MAEGAAADSTAESPAWQAQRQQKPLMATLVKPRAQVPEVLAEHPEADTQAEASQEAAVEVESSSAA